ncbi:hypothetical protein JCGZ_02776 [Jatropha curcas]|uniref:Uncharacterized protein n=1 Tax=Jatropha curcas TaxID=180498 RepID=A0A067KU89_JATCU|nr:hypothetical protein JCGZ_02776 [Jatropha curcas]
MGLASEEDVQVMFDQSKDQDSEVVKSEMAPKKVKASEMLKIAEVMKKKAKAESFNKGMPLVILDPPTVDAGAASESAHVKHGPLSPLIEPSRKRPCEVKVLVPSPPPLKLGEALDV